MISELGVLLHMFRMTKPAASLLAIACATLVSGVTAVPEAHAVSARTYAFAIPAQDLARTAFRQFRPDIDALGCLVSGQP